MVKMFGSAEMHLLDVGFIIVQLIAIGRHINTHTHKHTDKRGLQTNFFH